VKKFLKINVSAAGIRNIAKLGVFNALKKGYGK
jgi:ribosomal protein L28